MKQRKPMPRGKPLVRHTPMPRASAPLRRSPMPRGSAGPSPSDGPTPHPRGPVKPRVESSVIPSAIRAAVLERDSYSCQRCGRYLVDTIRYGLQHRRPRGAGGSRLLHTMANLVTLCGWTTDPGTCTAWVELEDRVRAAAEGWLLPHNLRTVTPEEWPVLRWTAAGHVWQQPGEQWTAAEPHERQREMLGEAA
jgi:hypothetical protein